MPVDEVGFLGWRRLREAVRSFMLLPVVVVGLGVGRARRLEVGECM